MTDAAAAYLTGLPAEIQAELVTIARTAIGLSAEEKGYAMGMCGLVARGFAIEGTDEQQPGAEMVAALGMVVRLVHDQATRGVSA